MKGKPFRDRDNQALHDKRMNESVRVAISRKNIEFILLHQNDSLEELSSYLQKCKNELGRVPAQSEVIGGDLLALRFGSWVNALDRSGFKNYTGRVAGYFPLELKALSYLSNVQDNKGGFSSWGTTNVESVAQVIVALCELGIDLNDSRFVKSRHGLVENLLSFRQSNGGFTHVLDGSDGNNQMSAEQGFYALVAIDRAENGKNSLYRMGDVTKNTSKPINKSKADASVNVPGVTAPGTTFADVKKHANKTAIEALASRGIINGMSKATFAPNKTMTRAEFAAIVTRALGLPAKDTKAFTDVPSSKWYASYIGAANSSGIVNGVGGGKFNPDGTITRQEAAAMVARAAKLCGLDTSMDAGATKDVLAQFGDYRSVASWAKESLAFCYYTNILDQSALKIEPTKAILRCEIAQMLYNMLLTAGLI